MNISSVQPVCSTTSTDTITITPITTSNYYSTDTITLNGSTSYSIGTGLTSSGSSTFTINNSTISTGASGYSSGSWGFNLPQEWVDSFPDFHRVEDMCKQYPGLAIAFEKFKTVYKLVKDDYDTPEDKRPRP